MQLYINPQPCVCNVFCRKGRGCSFNTHRKSGRKHLFRPVPTWIIGSRLAQCMPDPGLGQDQTDLTADSKDGTQALQLCPATRYDKKRKCGVLGAQRNRHIAPQAVEVIPRRQTGLLLGLGGFRQSDVVDLALHLLMYVPLNSHK